MFRVSAASRIIPYSCSLVRRVFIHDDLTSKKVNQVACKTFEQYCQEWQDYYESEWKNKNLTKDEVHARMSKVYNGYVQLVHNTHKRDQEVAYLGLLIPPMDEAELEKMDESYAKDLD